VISQSARATTAKEAAFRVQYPNSTRRAVKLVALDDKSIPAVERLLRTDPGRAALLPSPMPAAAPTVGSIKAWLSDFAGRTKALIAGISPADLVVLVATAGEDAQLGAVIGEACRARGVPVTAVVLDTDGVRDDVLAASLTRLRPYASMLVVARDHGYIEDMLAALRV
jgi:hypothetical protein